MSKDAKDWKSGDDVEDVVFSNNNTLDEDLLPEFLDKLQPTRSHRYVLKYEKGADVYYRGVNNCLFYQDVGPLDEENRDEKRRRLYSGFIRELFCTSAAFDPQVESYLSREFYDEFGSDTPFSTKWSDNSVDSITVLRLAASKNFLKRSRSRSLERGLLPCIAPPSELLTEEGLPCSAPSARGGLQCSPRENASRLCAAVLPLEPEQTATALFSPTA